jgi:predicted glycosyltransferase
MKLFINTNHPVQVHLFKNILHEVTGRGICKNALYNLNTA